MQAQNYPTVVLALAEHARNTLFELVFGDLLLEDSVHAASQPEIANLDRAVVIDQNVARLEISVDNFCLV